MSIVPQANIYIYITEKSFEKIINTVNWTFPFLKHNVRSFLSCQNLLIVLLRTQIVNIHLIKN